MSHDEQSDTDSPADTSVVGVLERFRAEGWESNHLAQPGGQVRCGSCREVSDASSLDVGARHRVEGASDPSDMQYVIGFACPLCGARGAVVAGFGPTASEQDQELVAKLPDLDDGESPLDPVATDPDD